MQRAVPFALSGVNPQTPKKKRYCQPLPSPGELTHNPPTAVSLAMLKGHWWVAHRVASHGVK